MQDAIRQVPKEVPLFSESAKVLSEWDVESHSINYIIIFKCANVYDVSFHTMLIRFSYYEFLLPLNEALFTFICNNEFEYDAYERCRILKDGKLLPSDVRLSSGNTRGS